MGVIAFEVFINGEHQYTVGAERWQLISAHVFGQHIDPAQIRASLGDDVPDLPTVPLTHVQLTASVSVPGEEVQVADSPGQVYTESKSGSYPQRKLSPGDIVEIRVTETDLPDSPEWRSNDPRIPGQTAILRKSEAK